MIGRPDILFIIKTRGLHYDDRVRKECSTLLNLNKRVEIIVLDDHNEKIHGVTEYNVPFSSIRLKTRNYFSSAKGLSIKIIEMYFRIFSKICSARPVIIWLHNIEMAGLIPFVWILSKVGIVNRIIWDQHELPPEVYFRNTVAHWVLLRLIVSCDKVIVANEERKKYLLSKLKIRRKEMIVVLENWPDRQFLDLPKHDLPYSIIEWLDGSPYFLAQGGANPDRYIKVLINLIISNRMQKLIVIGPFENDLIQEMKNIHHSSFDKYIHFTGILPQMQLTPFIDHALASIVLYSTERTNSYLCASNRMYQSVLRGTPVIVGCNPPMANFVRCYNVGVVLEKDGRDLDDLRKGIKVFTENNIDWSAKSTKIVDTIWERQYESICAVIGHE